jgi:hypothetical protein
LQASSSPSAIKRIFTKISRENPGTQNDLKLKFKYNTKTELRKPQISTGIAAGYYEGFAATCTDAC